MVRLEFPASFVYVNTIRLIITGLARQQARNEESIYDLKLAVSEIAGALIENNGIKKIKLSAENKGKGLVVNFNGLKNIDINRLFDSRLMDKQKIKLLVDNLSVLEEDNTVAITLYKQLDAN